MVMGIMFFTFLVLSFIALISFVVYIDYQVNNIPEHPQTEAESNVEMMKLRISQMNRKMNR
jgi:cytochrome c biogenesis factor